MPRVRRQERQMCAVAPIASRAGSASKLFTALAVMPMGASDSHATLEHRKDR